MNSTKQRFCLHANVCINKKWRKRYRKCRLAGHNRSLNGRFSHFSGGVSRSFKNFVILNISQTSQERHANNRSKSKDIPLLCWRLPHPCLVCHFLLTLELAAVLLRNGVPSSCGSAQPAGPRPDDITMQAMYYRSGPRAARQPVQRGFFTHPLANLHGKEPLNWPLNKIWSSWVWTSLSSSLQTDLLRTRYTKSKTCEGRGLPTMRQALSYVFNLCCLILSSQPPVKVVKVAPFYSRGNWAVLRLYTCPRSHS